MKPGIIYNRTFLWVGAIGFALLGVCWVLVSQPNFPVSSFWPAVLPYRFPIIGFLPVPFFLLAGKNKWALGWLLTVVPLFMAFNIHMLRPDLYFLWLCLLLAGLSKSKEEIGNGLLLLLGIMYGFTALQKMDTRFVEGMAHMLGKRIFIDQAGSDTLRYMAMSVPVVEVILAVLCVLRYRYLRMFVGVLVHISIIFFLLTGGWNFTMLPWNFLLLVLHLALPTFDYKTRKGIWLTVPALSFVLPVFFMLGMGFSFTAWNMYAGGIKAVRIPLDKETALYPLASVREFVYRKDGEYSLNVSEWAEYETGGPPCMEPVFYEKIKQDCLRYIKSETN